VNLALTTSGDNDPAVSRAQILGRAVVESCAASLVLRTAPDPVLRSVCEPVDTFDRALCELVEEMRQLMLRHEGVGLAAPQAGIPLRLFVAEIDGRTLSVVNPRLLRCGSGSETAVEGCLSLPGVEVPVSRAEAVEVRGRTPDGKAVALTLEGFWARVVQHEVDHLNGRLICDHAAVAVEPRGAERRP
jgi:peptide deformylase